MRLKIRAHNTEYDVSLCVHHQPETKLKRGVRMGHPEMNSFTVVNFNPRLDNGSVLLLKTYMPI